MVFLICSSNVLHRTYTDKKKYILKKHFFGYSRLDKGKPCTRANTAHKARSISLNLVPVLAVPPATRYRAVSLSNSCTKNTYTHTLAYTRTNPHKHTLKLCFAEQRMSARINVYLITIKHEIQIIITHIHHLR